MKFKIESPSCESCQSRLNNIFSSLTEEQAADLSVDKSGNYYKKGQIVFYEGNRPSGLFCVNKGKVKIYQMGSEGDPGAALCDGPQALLPNEFAEMMAEVSRLAPLVGRMVGTAP